LRVLEKTHFQIPTDLKALDQVLSQFNQLKQDCIAKKDWLQCQLALVEGFTNAVRHAHKDLPLDTPIDIEITLFTESLEIRITDQGNYFDLDAFLNNLKLRGENHSGGGRGIEILAKIADHLSYSRTSEKHNCLLIMKKFESEITES
jgi:serine/threonine-protein kinase RsbW